MYNEDEAVGDHDKGLYNRLERFVGVYISRYRRVVDTAKLSAEYLPDFYSVFPYKVQIYAFENGTYGIFFMKGDEVTIVSLDDGVFHEARWIIEDKACERFLGLRNIDEATTEMADALAEKDAERDISVARKKQALHDMTAELESLQGDIKDMAKVNPWLEDRAAGQIGRVSTARTVVETLGREVGDERYNMFREYASHFDILELQLPHDSSQLYSPQEANAMAEVATPPKRDEEDDIPTLSTIVMEDDFIAEERDVRPAQKKMQKPAPPRTKKPGTEEKPEKEKTSRETKAPEEVTPEIKNTVFRMNRRLFTLEKTVKDFEVLRPSELRRFKTEVQKLSKEQHALQIQLKKMTEENDKRHKTEMEDVSELLSREVKRARKLAWTIGMMGLMVAALGLILALHSLNMF